MLKFRGIVFTACVIFTLSILWNHAWADGYDHKINVEKMNFEWKVDSTNLNIRLSAKTTGWIGIGFSPTHKMKDANIIVAYVKKGKVKITDEFGLSGTVHAKDSKHGGKKDITSVSGTEENSMTTVSFTIPMNSADPKDKPINIKDDTSIILAYGAGRDSFRSRHVFSTTLKVNLDTGAYK